MLARSPRPSFHRPDVDEQHLVLAMVDDFAAGMAAADQVGWGELAFEDRVLI
jgi:hypothetical protein